MPTATKFQSPLMEHVPEVCTGLPSDFAVDLGGVFTKTWIRTAPLFETLSAIRVRQSSGHNPARLRWSGHSARHFQYSVFFVAFL